MIKRSKLPDGFDPDIYLKLNSDVKRAGINPKKHWLKFGQFEGRVWSLTHARPARVEPESLDARLADFNECDDTELTEGLAASLLFDIAAFGVLDDFRRLLLSAARRLELTPDRLLIQVQENLIRWTDHDLRTAVMGMVIDAADLLDDASTLKRMSDIATRTHMPDAAENLSAQFFRPEAKLQDHAIVLQRRQNQSVPVDFQSRQFAFAEWLGIPAAERDKWVEAVWDAHLDFLDFSVRVLQDDDVAKAFHQKVRPADTSLLRALVQADSSAVLAVPHAGHTIAAVSFLAQNGFDIPIIGGDSVSRVGMLGGDVFLPPDIGYGARISTGRKIVDFIRARKVFFESPDFCTDKDRHLVIDGPLKLYLPDSVARLCYRRKLPAVWMNTFWQGDEFVTEIKAAPQPEPAEDFTSFRARFFDFSLCEIRRVCLIDPRNAHEILDVIG